MPGALIVIEIAAPKVSDGALSVLVSACSRAARDAECVLARDANDEQPAAVAIVTLQSEDKMRVEVGVRQGDHDSWRTKEFSFLPADKSMDRWRSVGFAIGTLAESNPAPGEETKERIPTRAPASSAAAPASSAAVPASSATAPASSATAPASSATAPASSATAPASSAAAPASSAAAPADVDTEIPLERPVRSNQARATVPQVFVGAAAIFGPGLDTNGSWRLGGVLYADLALGEVPLFFTVGGSAATSLGVGSDRVTSRWFDILLGAGVPLLGRLDASGLEFRAQGLAEYFDAHASAYGDSDQNSRWTLGLQGAFGGRLQIVPDLLLTAELQAAGIFGETVVSVGNEPIGSSSNFRYLASAGLRVRLR